MLLDSISSKHDPFFVSDSSDVGEGQSLFLQWKSMLDICYVLCFKYGF
jgi:hypothetical protein